MYKWLLKEDHIHHLHNFAHFAFCLLLQMITVINFNGQSPVNVLVFTGAAGDARLKGVYGKDPYSTKLRGSLSSCF